MWTVHWDLALTAGGLIGVLALGVWAIYRMKRWREEDALEAPLSPDEQLQHYQKMVEDGLLDPQDFARIQARMQPKPAEPTPPSSNQPPDTSIRE
jgi:hypothetical protein